MVLTTSGSRDGERMPRLNSGTSMRFQRPSRITTGSLTLLIFKETELLPTLDAQQLTQDGGSSSNIKMLLLSMRKAKSWKSQEMLILKTETSKLDPSMEESTSNGILSMLMNGRVSQEKENLMKISD